MNALYPTILSDSVLATKEFYVRLLGLHTDFDSDWAVYLSAPSDDALKLAIVDRAHDSVPAPFQSRAAGVLISVEVEDVDQTWARAVGLGAPVRQPLRDEPFGQRHFMVSDPNGLLVDVITPIPFSDDFMAEHEAASSSPADG
jgi:catechol 2,3-dioxygenase-like lactoylglutathione lyase family enzyme